MLIQDILPPQQLAVLQELYPKVRSKDARALRKTKPHHIPVH